MIIVWCCQKTSGHTCAQCGEGADDGADLCRTCTNSEPDAHHHHPEEAQPIREARPEEGSVDGTATVLAVLQHGLQTKMATTVHTKSVVGISSPSSPERTGNPSNEMVSGLIPMIYTNMLTLCKYAVLQICCPMVLIHMRIC